MHITNIGTYLPKQCGIATFSHDTCHSLAANGNQVSAIAISDIMHEYSYPQEVIFNIAQPRRKDYLAAAEIINQSSTEAVILQHEYGIFGGKDGIMVLDFVQALQKPYLLITHTVPPHPTKQQRMILTQLIQYAGSTVVMSQSSALLLETLYDAPKKQIHLVPHGVPVFPRADGEMLKKNRGLIGRDIISTFGLIGPGKGLEIGLEAMRYIKEVHPQALYMILGETHPMLVKKEGERYREMLMQRVSDYSLENNVCFINQFLSDEELGHYLYMTDIYFSPYPYMGQAVSGTMAFAIGSGRAIVSTPYAYAREQLANGVGLLAQRADARELSTLLLSILQNPEKKQALQEKAKILGQDWQWPQIGQQYAALCHDMLTGGKELYSYA